MQARKLSMLVDLKMNQTTKTRCAWCWYRSNRVDYERLMSHLFATDLQRNYQVNLNIIGLDQRPAVKILSIVKSGCATDSM